MRILINDYCGHPAPLELSRELVRRGHTVMHAFFADNDSTPKGEVDTEQDPSGVIIRGLRIRQKFGKHNIFTRRTADLQYGEAIASIVETFKPDVVLSGNTPLDAQRLLMRACRRHKARFVFWFQDVYSIAVRFVLARKAKALASIIGGYYESLEKRLLRQSDAVVCIAPGFVDIARNWGVDPVKTHMIENWGPVNEIVPSPHSNAWAREQGIDGRFCYMYSGTLGMKHRPELLLALARRLEKQNDDAVVVVVAGGIGADWLKENSKDVSPYILRVLPFQPYERVPEMLGTSDVLLVLLDSEAGTFAVPSKTLSYLCAGRPLLVSAPAANRAAEVVTLAQAGLVVPPDSEQAFVDAALLMRANPESREQSGANARNYAQTHFSPSVVADRFMHVFSGGKSNT